MSKLNEQGRESVTIQLTADHHIPILRKRTLTLTRAESVCKVGRSSKVVSKGFRAAEDNAWFDSPVMSREHAEISVDFDKPGVFIRDIGSLHGIFIDNEHNRLATHRLVEMFDGTKLTFGVPIDRNSETFSPTTILVGIDFGDNFARSPAPATAVGSTYALDYVDDESSPSDDDVDMEEAVIERVVTKTDVKTATQLASKTLQTHRQVDMIDLSNSPNPIHEAVVDLTSPPRAGSLETDVSGNPGRVSQLAVNLTLPRGYTPKIASEQQEDEEGEELLVGTTVEDLDHSDDVSVIDVVSSQGSDDLGQSADISSDGEVTDYADSESDDQIVGDDEEGTSCELDDLDGDAEYSEDDDVLDSDDPDTAVWGVGKPKLFPANDNQASRPDAHPTAKNTQASGLDAATNDVAPATAGPNDRSTGQPSQMESQPLCHPCSFAGPSLTTDFPRTENAPVVAPNRLAMPSILNPCPNIWPSITARPDFPGRSQHASSIAQILGHRTGKHEFFAAREDNMLRGYIPPWAQFDNIARPDPVITTVAPNSDLPAAHSVGQEPPAENIVSSGSSLTRLEKSEHLYPQHGRYPNPCLSNMSVLRPDLAKLEAEETATVAKMVADDDIQAVEAAKQSVVQAAPEKGGKLDEAAENTTDRAAVPEGHVDDAAAYTADRAAEQTVEEMVEDTSRGLLELKASLQRPKSAGDRFMRTALLQRGHEFLCTPPPFSHFDSTRPGDEAYEPKSADELRRHKLAVEENLARRTHVGIADIVHASPAQHTQTPEPDAASTTKKRKADEMSELTQNEAEWARSESDLLRHMGTADMTMLKSTSPDSFGTHRALLEDFMIEFNEKKHGESMHGEPSSGTRAVKRPRLCKFAERLGYAALGGATVGAALVSTLIYTAPTFV